MSESRSSFWKVIWAVVILALAAACTPVTSDGFARPSRGPDQAFVLPTDEALLRAMKAIKRAFDPNNILNPGKIFDLDT